MLLTLLLVLTLAAQDGPVEFGRSELKKALMETDQEARFKNLRILVKGTGLPECFTLTLKEGRAVIEGTDATGAMYGALEMAERLRMRGKDAWKKDTVHGAPFLGERGLNIFLTLPWDYMKNGTDYDPRSLSDPRRWWFHSEHYWRTLFDRMATSRLNWLDLHGTWDVSVTNAPNLYAYFIQSEKYPEIGVDPEIKAANLARLNRVIDMAHARGIRISLMAYEAKTRIPHNPDPPYEETEELAYDYTKEMVEKMIRQAPGLDAIGFRIGESGRGGEFFHCYLEAVEASGARHPADHAKLGHPQGQGGAPRAGRLGFYRGDQIQRGALGRPPTPSRGGRVAGWYSYSFEDYLSDSGPAKARKMWPGHRTREGGVWPSQPYKIVWQVRANGTHRIFPFYEPEWVRRSIQAMKIGTASGFTVEPLNAYYPASPLYYLQTLEQFHCDWIHERDVLYLMQWGRLGYDPNTASDVFDHAAGRLLGPKSAGLIAAWKAASRVVPTAFCAYSLGPDHRSHAPELEWGGSTEMFIDREPFDSHAFMSMKEAFAVEAAGGTDGRLRPYEAGRLLEDLASRIRAGLEAYGMPGVPPLDEITRVRRDEMVHVLCMLANLADYYRLRFDAAYYEALAESGEGKPGKERVHACLEGALAAWRALSESQDARFYRPFTERLRMHTNTFHWSDELQKVQNEADRFKTPDGFQPVRPPSRFTPPPDGLKLSWKINGKEVVCSLPAGDLARAWLLHKPLPSSTFFHKVPMVRIEDRFECRFTRENHGHLIAAEVECGGHIRRIPRWEEETPYLVIPSRPGPTPPLYSSEEAMTYLRPEVLDPDRYGLLLLASRAWNFHRFFDVSTQRKLLDAVANGMTLLVLQQDYTSGRYPLSWLPVKPQLKNRNDRFFEPEGALGLSPIERDQILWQPFVPSAGWEVFGNGGLAKTSHGKGTIWMVQARLMQNMHVPACAKALVRLLEIGGRSKPLVVIDAGTEGAHYATSVFADLMNAHEIPFLTLGEVIAREQGMRAFEPVPGRPWNDDVLHGEGREIMKRFLEAKVRSRAAAPLPESREEWEKTRKKLGKEWKRCMGLDPPPG